MKLLYIDPVGPEYFTEDLRSYLHQIKDTNVEIDITPLTRGPATLEFRYYESLVIPDIVHKVIEAEKSGYDGVIVGCFYDPGLYVAREVSGIPIIGAGESSMHIAATLGYKFSIIVGRTKWIPLITDNIMRYSFKEKLSSFKSLELDILEFQKNAKTYEKILSLSQEAIKKDGAEVIILGCTMQYGFYKRLQEELKIPVIDPVISALQCAQFMVELKQKFGWGHSKIGSFQGPKIEEIKRWKIQEQYKLKNLWNNIKEKS